ncbi:chemotaxis protein CheW [Pleurocapsa sp. CCALA 161]|uniref:chemotaxis protein CheW n=1 Tax=Pleurocapsa sp. CCALA 161 TaxID=2107688 RepID=UPI000D04A443|nr:chemotaxis protein CheW [Pleurocapsa sp. CCALA 161]PSB11032.1 chemotaxis protein CheW [Pleurocapsa sp. CCALA 161]
MSNLIVDSSLNTAVQSNRSIKLLVFEIGKLTLALPILQVQKVVKQIEVYGSGLSHVNLAHFPEQEIAIVDLHQKLFGISLTQSESSGYVIISKNIADEPLGIAVSQAPTLMDVSLEQIRLLPDTYRRADTLEIASHVTVISQKDAVKTIFILDLTRLV